MRSQPKNRQLLKPDAAPRGDSSYVFILIKRSTLPNGADSIHAPHITRICDFIYEGFSSFNPGFLSMADQLRPVIVVCVYCVCAMCRVPVLPPPPHRPHQHVHRLLGPAPAAPPPARAAAARVRADLRGQVAGLSCRRNLAFRHNIQRRSP